MAKIVIVPFSKTKLKIQLSPKLTKNLIDWNIQVMRRMGLSEEKGSGIDKVIGEVELFQLPAPDFQVKLTHTKAILYAPQKLNQMGKNDKTRACYQHCCLKYTTSTPMTNQTMRERFGIEDKNYPMASKIIKETIEVGFIKEQNPDSNSKKFASYIPFWA